MIERFKKWRQRRKETIKIRIDRFEAQTIERGCRTRKMQLLKSIYRSEDNQTAQIKTMGEKQYNKTRERRFKRVSQIEGLEEKIKPLLKTKQDENN